MKPFRPQAWQAQHLAWRDKLCFEGGELPGNVAHIALAFSESVILAIEVPNKVRVASCGEPCGAKAIAGSCAEHLN